MKNLILLAILLSGTLSYAGDFQCVVVDNTGVKVTGSFDEKSASITIKDLENKLEIRELKPHRVIEIPRYNRVREPKYTFAKYYSDFSAFQDIDISIPKQITSNIFTGFLTVYEDDGDHMVPREANRLRCRLTSN